MFKITADILEERYSFQGSTREEALDKLKKRLVDMQFTKVIIHDGLDNILGPEEITDGSHVVVEAAHKFMARTMPPLETDDDSDLDDLWADVPQMSLGIAWLRDANDNPVPFNFKDQLYVWIINDLDDFKKFVDRFGPVTHIDMEDDPDSRVVVATIDDDGRKLKMYYTDTVGDEAKPN